MVCIISETKLIFCHVSFSLSFKEQLQLEKLLSKTQIYCPHGRNVYGIYQGMKGRTLLFVLKQKILNKILMFQLLALNCLWTHFHSIEFLTKRKGSLTINCFHMPRTKYRNEDVSFLVICLGPGDLHRVHFPANVFLLLPS